MPISADSQSAGGASFLNRLQRSAPSYGQQLRRDAVAYKSLYSFQGGADGANPQAGLTYVGGTLYGTTVFGGARNDGTVFKITRSGAESEG